jgi:probable HAF family extracellular repeat protein
MSIRCGSMRWIGVVTATMVVVLGGIVGATPAGAAQRYEVKVITPPGGFEGFATGVNGAGQATIVADQGGRFTHPFAYSGGAWTAIGPLLSCPDPDVPGISCSESTAAGINENGQIVGTAGNFHLNHAYRFDLQTGSVDALPTLGGDSSWGYGINENGQLAGAALNGAGKRRAFLWNGTTMRGLGTLGGPNSVAFATASDGQAVGCADTASGLSHPFWFRGGTMRDLGVPAGWSDGCASTINGGGLIGGTSTLSTSGTLQCIGWLRSYSGFDLLPVPTGSDCVEVRHLNEQGQVVGTYTKPAGRFGFVYDDGVLRTLDRLIPFDRGTRIVDANGNAGTGVIAGETLDEHGISAVLLRPIRIFDETNHAISYAGSWSSVAAADAFHGHLASSSDPNGTATLTFTGRGVSIIGPTGPGLGAATVFLDGDITVISEQRTAVQQRKRIFKQRFSQVGTHTITIDLRGDAPFRLDAITVSEA